MDGPLVAIILTVMSDEAQWMSSARPIATFKARRPYRRTLHLFIFCRSVVGLQLVARQIYNKSKCSNMGRIWWWLDKLPASFLRLASYLFSVSCFTRWFVCWRVELDFFHLRRLNSFIRPLHHVTQIPRPASYLPLLIRPSDRHGSIDKGCMWQIKPVFWLSFIVAPKN